MFHFYGETYCKNNDFSRVKEDASNIFCVSSGYMDRMRVTIILLYIFYKNIRKCFSCIVADDKNGLLYSIYKWLIVLVMVGTFEDDKHILKFSIFIWMVKFVVIICIFSMVRLKDLQLRKYFLWHFKPTLDSWQYRLDMKWWERHLDLVLLE